MLVIHILYYHISTYRDARVILFTSSDPVPVIVQYTSKAFRPSLSAASPATSHKWLYCTLGGAADSVVPVDMVTDPTQNNIFNRPVVQIVPAIPGVSILAQ